MKIHQDVDGCRYQVVEFEIEYEGFEVTVEQGLFEAHHLFRHVLRDPIVSHIDLGSGYGEASFMIAGTLSFYLIDLILPDAVLQLGLRTRVPCRIVHCPSDAQAFESEQGLWWIPDENEKPKQLGSGRCPYPWTAEYQWKMTHSTGSLWEDPGAAFLADDSRDRTISSNLDSPARFL